MSFVALSRLLCLLDSWSSDLSSWFGFRKDSRSPSIPSSLEFLCGSCWRFVDTRGKLSALRTLRHNLDVDPWRRRNSWNEKALSSNQRELRDVIRTTFYVFQYNFNRLFMNTILHCASLSVTQWTVWSKTATRESKRVCLSRNIFLIILRVLAVFAGHLFFCAWIIYRLCRIIKSFGFID